MKELQILSKRPGCSEEKLRALDHTIGAEVPKDYRDFLRDNDGGIAGPRNRFIDARLHRQLPVSILIDRFLGINDMMHIRHEYALRIPTAFLAIADNTFGDLVLLDLRPANNKVVYWDHEEEEFEDEQATEIPAFEHPAFIKIATSFTEFAELLGPIPDA